jgi:hypothetical protein
MSDDAVAARVRPDRLELVLQIVFSSGCVAKTHEGMGLFLMSDLTELVRTFL